MGFVMCRFIVMQSKEKISVSELIFDFAKATEKCVSFDGDWQGDGWGMCWLNDNNKWMLYKSIAPIWEEEKNFTLAPPTTSLLVHARSASFEKHKNNLNFNQPYINNSYAYVFNGLIKGIRLPYLVEGEIGAQKIWSLLQKYLNEQARDKEESALVKLQETLLQYSKKIQAANIVFCNSYNIYCISIYNAFPDYYQLNIYNSEKLKIISSLKLRKYDFELLLPGIYKF